MALLQAGLQMLQNNFSDNQSTNEAPETMKNEQMVQIRKLSTTNDELAPLLAAKHTDFIQRHELEANSPDRGGAASAQRRGGPGRAGG